MNVPAIAKRTFEELRHKTEYLSMVQEILKELQQLSGPLPRAKFVHTLVEEFNLEVFANPIVKQFSPCTVGCSGCCHTQVSVTEDEAFLLLSLIDGGVTIDQARLDNQAQAGNESEAYYKMSYAERKCVFLDDAGACKVYANRPSVCRTNAVLGEKDQCDTSVSIKPTRLIKTPKSDLVIYASYMFAKSSGTLPFMLKKVMSAE